MTKNKLAEGVFQYAFSPNREGGTMGNTIVAIIDNDKALLIDTAYEHEASQLKAELESNGIIVQKIIISHWHSDHFSGLNEFPQVPVYGSANHVETRFSEGVKQEEIDEFPSFNEISERTKIELGKHKIELIPFSGHSVCTLLVKINEEFLFAADDILLTIDGKLMLPWLCGKGSREKLIDKQLAGWNELRNYSSYRIIPAHGPAFEGEKLAGYLDNLTSYLSAVKDANGKISYEDAIKNCPNPPANQLFAQSSWHEANCQDR